MSLAASSRSEITKQFTTSGWWILAIVLVVYLGLLAGGMGWFIGAVTTGQIGPEEGMVLDESAPLTIYGVAASIGYVFPLLIGTLIVTTEFRHQMLTPTFLATPRRGVALGGKVVGAIVMGLVYGVLALIAVVGPAAALLAGLGVDPLLSSGDTWLMLGRTLLALVLWTLIGLGLGLLVRNQVAAIVIVLAFTQFVEPILRMAGGFVEWLGEVTEYLPGAASDALVGHSFYELMGAATLGDLTWWGGGLVLAAYAVVFLVIGYFTSWRRDVS